MLDHVIAGKCRIPVRDLLGGYARRGQHQAVFVFDRDMEQFADATIRLFATCSSIGNVDSVAVYWHASKDETKIELPRLLVPRRESPERVLIYDQTGIFDDIACFKSHEVEPIMQQGGTGTSYAALPQFENMPISSHWEEVILRGTRAAAVTLVLGRLMGGLSEETESEYVRNFVEGISFGKLSFPVDDNDMDNWAHELYPKSIDLAAAYLLATEGYVRPDEATKEMLDTMLSIPSLLAIWEHATRTAGLPVTFLASQGSKADAETIMAMGSLLGADSMIDAYFAGVPLEDIFA